MAKPRMTKKTPPRLELVADVPLKGGIATNYFKLSAYGARAMFFPFNDVTIDEEWNRATLACELYDSAYAPRINSPRRGTLSVFRAPSRSGPWSAIVEVGAIAAKDAERFQHTWPNVRTSSSGAR